MFSPSSNSLGVSPRDGGAPAPMLDLEPDDKAAGGLASSSDTNQSFCGMWLPWLNSRSNGEQSTNSVEEAESIIDSILTASLMPNYAERVLPQLEVLLDKHGIESVIYLPSKAGGQVPVGKKCMIRSQMDQARVEFRVRSAGELKKMKFDWKDIEEMGAGKYVDTAPVASNPNTTPTQAQTIATKKGQANCYIYIKIINRGTVDLRFESKALRDATLVGFKLLRVKRQDRLA